MAGGWISGLRGALGRFGALPGASPPQLARPTGLDSWTSLVESSVRRIAVEASAWLDGEQVAVLSVTDGSVTADIRRGIMRDGSLALVESPGLSFAETDELVATSALEVRIRRGFELDDGSTLTAPLGCFTVDRVEAVSSPGEHRLSLSLTDISARIARAVWTSAYQLAAGTNLASALAAMLGDRYPLVQTGFSPDAVPEVLATAVTITGESDPWADAMAIAAAYGYTLIMDAEGVCRLLVPPDPTSTDPAYTFRRGWGLITSRSMANPLDKTYNGVIVRGESSGGAAPVQGEAWDENPLSRTYRYGPFGQRPLPVITTSLATTQAQCEAMARAELNLRLGRVEELSWTQVVDPARAPLDVVGIPDEKADIVRRHVLDAVTTPLSVGGVQTVLTRSTTVVE